MSDLKKALADVARNLKSPRPTIRLQVVPGEGAGLKIVKSKSWGAQQ